MAASLNDLCDVKKHMPGFLQATHSWFKNYKIPAGKPVNKFAFNGQPKNAKFALKVIKQTNDQWRQLIKSSESADGSTNMLVCSVSYCTLSITITSSHHSYLHIHMLNSYLDLLSIICLVFIFQYCLSNQFNLFHKYNI